MSLASPVLLALAQLPLSADPGDGDRTGTRLVSDSRVFAGRMSARFDPTTPKHPQGLPLALCGLDRL